MIHGRGIFVPLILVAETHGLDESRGTPIDVGRRQANRQIATVLKASIVTPEPRAGFDPDELSPWEEGQGRSRLTFRRAETIQPTRPDWRWERWLSTAALHLLVGRQGNGKTTFATWVLSQLERGSAVPRRPSAKRSRHLRLTQLRSARRPPCGSPRRCWSRFGAGIDPRRHGGHRRRRPTLPTTLAIAQRLHGA